MRSSSGSFLAFIVLVVCSLAVGAAEQEGTAEGTLTVAGNPTKLTHAYAWAADGTMDPTRQDVVIILSDVPLDPGAIRDRFRLRELEKAGTLHAVEARINFEKQPLNVTVRHSAFKMPCTGASTEDIFEATTFDDTTIAGRLYRRNPGESFDDIPYTFDVKFTAPIAPKVEK